MKYYFIRQILIILLIVGCFACKHSNTPKPYGYFRINLPEKTYQKYMADCPFVFEYPQYGAIEVDTTRSEYCWFNILFKEYNAKIYLSYKPIKNNLDEYTEDSRTFAYKHSIKAESIKERVFVDTTKQVYGLLYEIEGNAASSTQFYVTDSVTHFLRGALYFNNAPNKDSLAPVIHFFREDILHFVETLEWK